MGCPSEVEIGDNLTFSITTHDPDTGVLTDTDSAPTYRVYEDETTGTGTAGQGLLFSGTMAKLDDANTTGFYTETIACTSGNGLENGKTYTIYIEAIVDSDKGGICFGFKAYDYRKSNVKAVSDDSTAADNLELQYDTTGLTGDTFPATQSQVGNIATGAGGLSTLIVAFAKVGAEPETNTFTATQQGDGVYHIVEDDAGNTDFYYQATVGAGGKATAFTWKGYVQSNGDSTSVWYWDWVATAYKQIDTLTGSNGTTPAEEVFLVPVGATGTGADQGKVRLRFLSTTTTAIATDRLLCEFTQASQSVGYANGQVWVDSNSSNTNTVSFVDGVADNVAGSWVNAVTISGQVGLTDFHIINGSTIALSGTSDNFSLFGDNWILQLASRSVAGAYFQGAQVSGVSTSATEVHFEGCAIATMSVQKGHFDFCSFSGTVTHTLTGDYNYHNCYSGVPGSGGPTFAKTAGQAITAQWRGWKGSINLTGLQVGDTLTIGGVELGTIDLGSPAGAVVVEIRGIYKEITNIGSAAVNLEGAINAADVASAYAGPRGPGVYLNDAAANTNTVDGFDGTLLNPVSTIAAAKTIADSLGVDRIYLVNDSSATLAATMEDYEFVGIGEMSANSINFGTQDVDQAVFYNLLLTGAQGGTGRCQAEDCVLSTITGMEITALRCLYADAGSLTLRNDCAFDSCFSAVAGSGTPTLDINSVANVNVYFRHYSGGMQIDNAVATTVVSFEADGQLVIDATCTSLTVVVRGNCSITDNGTTTSLTQDAAINRTGINAECDTALSDINLDELIKNAVGVDFDTTVAEDSVIGQLAHDGIATGGGFNRTNHSLEALRVQGDAAWITATGFSTLDAAGIRSAVGLASANLDTQLGAIPTTAMRGTDSAALASVCTEVRLAELDAANLPTDIAAIPTTAMRGTDSAALASVCTEVRLAELDAANLPTDIAAIPTTAMRGTDSAALAAVCTEVRLAELDAANLPSDVDAIKVITDALTSASATQLALSAGTIVSGAAEAGTLSTTQMSTDLSETTNDHYNGRIVIWTSGVLQNQATDITDYVGTNGVLTFTAVTEAPSAADTFIIV